MTKDKSQRSKTAKFVLGFRKPMSQELKIAESLLLGYLLALVATDVLIRKPVAAQHSDNRSKDDLQPSPGCSSLMRL